MRYFFTLSIFLASAVVLNGQTFTAYSVTTNGGSGSSMVDYDGDGDLDVYVTIGNNLNNVLFEND